MTFTQLQQKLSAIRDTGTVEELQALIKEFANDPETPLEDLQRLRRLMDSTRNLKNTIKMIKRIN